MKKKIIIPIAVVATASAVYGRALFLKKIVIPLTAAMISIIVYGTAMFMNSL